MTAETMIVMTEEVVVAGALMVHVAEVGTDAVEEATTAVETVGDVRCEAKNY
jgi:hypothetical protein